MLIDVNVNCTALESSKAYFIAIQIPPAYFNTENIEQLARSLKQELRKAKIKAAVIAIPEEVQVQVIEHPSVPEEELPAHLKGAIVLNGA